MLRLAVTRTATRFTAEMNAAMFTLQKSPRIGARPLPVESCELLAARIGGAAVEAMRRADVAISRNDRRKFLGRCAVKDHAVCPEIELPEDLSRALLRRAGC